jgi:Kef-type K+ transport system membrane component KefB
VAFVDLTQGLNDLVAVALVAALAPLVVAVLPGPRIPQVVILLLGGVLIGPHVLGLAETSSIRLLANIGLGFLFLLAGFDAVGYGIFIPIFFVSSGMSLDLKAISRDPLRLLIFFLMLLIVRGLPSLLVYRRALPARQRVEMTFITATTLPLLIALADIGQQDGVMLPATAAALVGAGVLSVLVYPLIAVRLHRSAALTPADAGIAAAGSAAATGAPAEVQGPHDQSG